MSESKSASANVVEAATKQAIAGAVGAGLGALTAQTIKPGVGPAHKTAAQVGSAMGAAVRNGAGLGGAAAAGAAVVTGQVAAATAVAVAAAPVVLTAAAVGAVGYGIYKFFKWAND